VKNRQWAVEPAADFFIFNEPSSLRVLEIDCHKKKAGSESDDLLPAFFTED
jgi:hypothetical protein